VWLLLPTKVSACNIAATKQSLRLLFKTVGGDISVICSGIFRLLPWALISGFRESAAMRLLDLLIQSKDPALTSQHYIIYNLESSKSISVSFFFHPESNHWQMVPTYG